MVADFNDGTSVKSSSDTDANGGDKEKELENDDEDEPAIEESFEVFQEEDSYSNTEDAMSLDSATYNDVQNLHNQSAEADVSLVSTTSTVRLRNIHFCACDVAKFYTHLPQGVPTKFSLERKWLDIPLVLIEIKRNASRKFAGEESNRMFSLERSLEKAQM